MGVLASNLHSYTVIGNWNNSNYGISLRNKYKDNPRLSLLDPIYDPVALAHYRESCSSYIHGHSVGGTNPSLVEMVYYDCNIFCLDVVYHHATMGDCAKYFQTAQELAVLLNTEEDMQILRNDLKAKYSRNRIAGEYLDLCI